jgi:hypothetical protein
LDHFWKKFGRVLAISMKKHDMIEVVLDCVTISNLLISPVSKIDWILED